jgi:hypothetical protein
MLEIASYCLSLSPYNSNFIPEGYRRHCAWHYHCHHSRSAPDPDGLTQPYRSRSRPRPCRSRRRPAITRARRWDPVAPPSSPVPSADASGSSLKQRRAGGPTLPLPRPRHCSAPPPLACLGYRIKCEILPLPDSRICFSDYFFGPCGLGYTVEFGLCPHLVLLASSINSIDFYWLVCDQFLSNLYMLVAGQYIIHILVLLLDVQS